MNDLIDTADIAQMLGVSREHVTDRITKKPDFPAPRVKLSRRIVRWAAEDVRAWMGLGQPERESANERA